jgi:hypothetical protein
MGRISYKDIKGSAIEGLKNNNIINTIVSNPFFISVLIVFTILLILYINPVNKCNQAIYSFIATILLILSHDVIIRDRYKEKSIGGSGIYKDTVVADKPSVKPRQYFDKKNTKLETDDDSIEINEIKNTHDNILGGVDPELKTFLNLK